MVAENFARIAGYAKHLKSGLFFTAYIAVQ